MSNDDGLTKTAKRIEAVRKIITNTIWIAIVVVVLAAIGRYLVVKDAPKTTEVGPQEKPVVQPGSIPCLSHYLYLLNLECL